MTTSQVDKRNKKANRQREESRSSERSSKKRLYNLREIEIKQIWFLAFHISTPISRRPSHTCDNWAPSEFLAPFNQPFFSEAGSNSFLRFATNRPWDNEKKYNLLVLCYLKHPPTYVEDRYYCLHFMGGTKLQEVNNSPKFVHPEYGRVVFRPELSNSKSHSLTTTSYCLPWPVIFILGLWASSLLADLPYTWAMEN